MKPLNTIFLFLCLILFSCSHESEMIYHSLPIEKEYEAFKYVFDRSEISSEELNEMPNLKLVINSEEEFPEEDIMGLEELKANEIDFQKYTLLLVYYKVQGVVESYNYKYSKDFENNVIIFSINYHLARELMEDTENPNLFTYCRSAILVSKIPEETEVEFRLSY